jgi:Ca2+-binding RTX toxin-like protein
MTIKIPIWNIADTTYQFSLNGDEFAVGGELSSQNIDNCIRIRDDQGLDTFDFHLLRRGVTIDLGQFGGESFVTNLEGGPHAKIVCESLIENATGGRASDTIYGNDYANVIIGGRGGDDLWGNDGSDTFVYRGIRSSTVLLHDTIEDFVSGEDYIVLRQLDANSTLPGRQHFRWIDDHAFSKHAGELRFHNGHLLGDTNGDGHADFRIDIGGDAEVHRADLIL